LLAQLNGWPSTNWPLLWAIGEIGPVAHGRPRISV
jgi:hypothetical protein